MCTHPAAFSFMSYSRSNITRSPSGFDHENLTLRFSQPLPELLHVYWGIYCTQFVIVIPNAFAMKQEMYMFLRPINAHTEHLEGTELPNWKVTFIPFGLSLCPIYILGPSMPGSCLHFFAMLWWKMVNNSKVYYRLCYFLHTFQHTFFILLSLFAFRASVLCYVKKPKLHLFLSDGAVVSCVERMNTAFPYNRFERKHNIHA